MPAGDKPIVISASRRTDLAACHPDVLITSLREYPPERVHTVVIWTKNPVRVMANDVLLAFLKRYRSLYVHLTVTGLGGSRLEPGVPRWDDVRSVLPGLVAFAGGGEHVCWRFDPLLHVRGETEEYRNLPLFADLAPAFATCGVFTVRTSWVTEYKKVTARLKKAGLALLPHDTAQIGEQVAELQRMAAAYAMNVYCCCVPGRPVSSCIDGALLTRIHPDGLACSTRKARGQRPGCGCTESRDIGWYSQTCDHRCLYCYAAPARAQDAD
jgi:DNA repair photolyase